MKNNVRLQAMTEPLRVELERLEAEWLEEYSAGNMSIFFRLKEKGKFINKIIRDIEDVYK